MILCGRIVFEAVFEGALLRLLAAADHQLGALQRRGHIRGPLVRGVRQGGLAICAEDTEPKRSS